MKCGGVPRRTTTIATLGQSPGQFLLFFKHFLELNDAGRQAATHLYLNFPFFSFYLPSILVRKAGEKSGARLRFVFFLMGNFLGSKWARFMNAFVGCLWGGPDAQPYIHPPSKSHPRMPRPFGKSECKSLLFFFFF